MDGFGVSRYSKLEICGNKILTGEIIDERKKAE